MPRRQPNYGPGPSNYGPGQYSMHGPGYQAMQYGSGGYGSGGYGSDMYDGSGSSSYPTPVCSIVYR